MRVQLTHRLLRNVIEETILIACEEMLHHATRVDALTRSLTQMVRLAAAHKLYASASAKQRATLRTYRASINAIADVDLPHALLRILNILGNFETKWRLAGIDLIDRVAAAVDGRVHHPRRADPRACTASTMRAEVASGCRLERPRQSGFWSCLLGGGARATRRTGRAVTSQPCV